MQNLSERHRRVLQAVINDYTLTAEPVGSRTISRKYLNLSPATVRNVMSDLEEMGYLRQPHTSAGRVPTDTGMRLYLDDLLELRSLTPREQDRLRADFESGLHQGRDLMKRTSHFLSLISNQVGVVVAPCFDEFGLKHIEFVRLGARRVMAVIISDRALVQHRVVETEADVAQTELDGMARYLNEILAGLTLRQIRARIEEELRGHKATYDRLLSCALELGRLALAGSLESDLYVEDRTRILEQPEFLDIEKMKGLFRAFEEKSQILKPLDAVLEGERVSVVFGSETALTAMSGCSLIATRYTTGPRGSGTLGVIGPTRMNYGKVIPVVEYVAKLVSEYLN